MIQRIAIVNRGEAALRCVRAVRELRLEEGWPLVAVALYSDAERSAAFVRLADEAVSLGAPLRAPRGATARPVYLDRSRVLAALRARRIDTVWPGWGFLAEDADFVELLEARRITFLGPSSATIRALGDKIEAKRIAEGQNVPVTRWSGGRVTADVLEATADDVGYPLMIKAAAGGGGRGIRVVREPGDLRPAFLGAVAEAEHAFGDGRVFFEALVDGSRHVEVQIAADRDGRCRTLGLRDCSLQRRHQKVIEESPPPALAAEVERELRECAVRIAQAVGYRGLGTVEFLLDAAAGDLWFLEVNPRLQVEHGLTEARTGWDLVKLQLRLARGDALPEHDPEESGHAIQARVCAEDPDADFVPTPGTVVRLDLPAGPGIRVDCGLDVGARVPAAFDSLIAKVIAHGSDRRVARARLMAALGEMRLVLQDGATNRGFLLELLGSEAFRRGEVDTGWVSRRTPSPTRLADKALIIAAILVYLQRRERLRATFLADAKSGVPRPPPKAGGAVFELTHRGERYRLSVRALGGSRYALTLDERKCTAILIDPEPWACQLEIEGTRFNATWSTVPDGLRIEVDGHAHRIDRDSGGLIRAAAAAVVMSVEVEPGTTVAVGQRLGLLETMKMETVLRAPSSGTVDEILVHVGQRVAAGDALLRLQRAEQDTEARPGPRIALPEETEPTALLFDEAGAPDLRGLEGHDVATREHALDTVHEGIRAALLGFDEKVGTEHPALRWLLTEIPVGLHPRLLRKMAEVRHALAIFADTQSLFSRQPTREADGRLGPSHDAQLRLYLSRISAAAEHLPEEFRAILRRTLQHYGLFDLRPGEALERALVRVYAAREQRPSHRTIARAVIRFLRALAEVGVDLTGDPLLSASLATIASLGTEVGHDLADAAREAHHHIFVQPWIRAEADAAAEQIDEQLRRSTSQRNDLRLRSIADSPAPVFDRIARWMAEPDPHRRNIALQALVLRRYAPLAPEQHTVHAAGELCFDERRLSDGRWLSAAVVLPHQLEQAWARLATPPISSPDGWIVDLIVPASEGATETDIHERARARAAASPSTVARICITFLNPGGARTHLVFQREGTGSLRVRNEFFGLHPETLRRIELDRLERFSLQRLPGAESIHVFAGRGRTESGDRRIFVHAEARAALPTERIGLHEPALFQTLNRALHLLRAALTAAEARSRPQENRIAVFLYPGAAISPETARRVVTELSPHLLPLDLSEVVVHFRHPREADGGPCEMVVAPGSTGRAVVTWRPWSSEPLANATPRQRRIAAARRGGLFEPYELIETLLRTTELADVTGPGELVEHRPNDAGQTPSAPASPATDRSGVVFGVIRTPTTKHPEGMARVLIASDPMTDMGALGVEECNCLVAALDLADREGLPVEWWAVSSGARIAMDSGTENLDATARVARRLVELTERGHEINVIVAGVNVGAQSYFDALATMLRHTRGILIMTPSAAMVLTGRRALEASGSVSAEDEQGIGGFERIMGPSGQAQYYARDLDDAYGILLEHYRYAYIAPGERRPRRHDTRDPGDRLIGDGTYDEIGEHRFRRIADVFDDAVNPGRKQPFAMRPVMRALIDGDGGHLERWSAMLGAETAIVWDAHLGGHAICLIGIESRPVPRLDPRPLDGPESWTGGTLFPLSSKKVARALNAASGARPVVVLANLSGFDGSPESMRRLQLEHGAEIARAVVLFDGPILFVVVSRYHGGAYVVFSRALNENLKALALEGSYASVIGGAPAATVVFAREVETQTQSDPRVAELRRQLATARGSRAALLESELATTTAAVRAEIQAEIARRFDAIHTVERARRVGSLDAIVPLSRLRPHLIRDLDSDVGCR